VQAQKSSYLHCSTLQHVAKDCNTLQHTATQHTAAHCYQNRAPRRCVFFYFGRTRHGGAYIALQHAATRATHNNTLRHTATHCKSLQHSVTHCNTLQNTATHCNTRQYMATHGNTLHHTATHCNTPRDTATHCNTNVPNSRAGTHCSTLQHSLTNVACNRGARAEELISH